jgi:hypothetical protein
VQTVATIIFKFGRWAVLLSAVVALALKTQLFAWPTPFMFNNALYWYGFFAVGYLVGKPMIQYLSGGVRCKWIAMITAIIAVIFIGRLVPLCGDWGHFAEDMTFIAFAVGFMTFWSFFDGNKRLEFLRFYGKNSLLVLGFNGMILTTVSRASFKLIGIHHPLLGLLYSVIVALCLIPLIHLSNRRIPFLVGKKPLFDKHFSPQITAADRKI